MPAHNEVTWLSFSWPMKFRSKSKSSSAPFFCWCHLSRFLSLSLKSFVNVSFRFKSLLQRDIFFFFFFFFFFLAFRTFLSIQHFFQKGWTFGRLTSLQFNFTSSRHHWLQKLQMLTKLEAKQGTVADHKRYNNLKTPIGTCFLLFVSSQLYLLKTGLFQWCNSDEMGKRWLATQLNFTEGGKRS